MNDAMIMEGNFKNFRYNQKTCCVIKSNGSVVWYNVIMLTYLNTMESYVSEYTEYFFKKNTINLSINTKKNRYGSLFVSFLNYIFFDIEKPLRSINELTFDIGSQYLNKYGIGEINYKKNKDGSNITKTKATVEIAEQTLISLYYWLYNTYKLKNIKYKDFVFLEKRTKFKNKPTMVLESKFIVEYPNKITIPKIESPDDMIVLGLIDVARNYDPMMALPIALQAFVGIRRGEVCQAIRGRFDFRRIGGILYGMSVDLREERLLRSDGVSTGEIKVHRVQIAYPAFLQYFDKLYNEHLIFLKNKGLDNDNYGALFFGNNSKAMTTDNYARRFEALIPRLMEKLYVMKNMGNQQASTNYELLLMARMTPHSLRDFFSEYVAHHEPAHMLATYRGDSSLGTALIYLRRARGIVKEIENIQNSFTEIYKKVLGKTF